MLVRLSLIEKAQQGTRLKAAREVMGLTQAEAALKAGVSDVTVQKWEAGSVPGDEARAKLAELYDVDEDTLFAEVAAHRRAAEQLLKPA
jgi:transcriptional regulator with XRE-family HTH domain